MFPVTIRIFNEIMKKIIQAATYTEVIKLSHSIKKLKKQLKKMDTTLDEVLDEVKSEGSQIESLSLLTSGLKQQLQEALTGVSLPPSVQAKVDAIFAGVEENKQKVVDALNANTPEQAQQNPNPGSAADVMGTVGGFEAAGAAVEGEV